MSPIKSYKPPVNNKVKNNETFKKVDTFNKKELKNDKVNPYTDKTNALKGKENIKPQNIGHFAQSKNLNTKNASSKSLKPQNSNNKENFMQDLENELNNDQSPIKFTTNQSNNMN